MLLQIQWLPATLVKKYEEIFHSFIHTFLLFLSFLSFNLPFYSCPRPLSLRALLIFFILQDIIPWHIVVKNEHIPSS